MVWRMQYDISDISKLVMRGVGLSGNTFPSDERLFTVQWVRQIVAQLYLHIINWSTSHPLHQLLDQIEYSPVIDTGTRKEGRKEGRTFIFCNNKNWNAISFTYIINPDFYSQFTKIPKIQYLNEKHNSTPKMIEDRKKLQTSIIKCSVVQYNALPY